MKLNIDAVPESLRAFFREHRKAAIAFSGGCDSAYLLYAGVACGAEILPCYVKSPFQPEFELEDARRLADELGIGMQIVSLNVLDDENVRKNLPERCYFCKRRIFEAILACAKEHGFDTVMDGTNASDDADDRPGMRALGEMKVLSPLRFCGIAKAQVRALSKQAGIFTWNKPAYACLATRLPAGEEITAGALERIERCEKRLMDIGFEDFRIRTEGRNARIELTEVQISMALERRKDILRALENDFEEISLSLRARKGMEI